MLIFTRKIKGFRALGEIVRGKVSSKLVILLNDEILIKTMEIMGTISVKNSLSVVNLLFESIPKFSYRINHHGKVPRESSQL